MPWRKGAPLLSLLRLSIYGLGVLSAVGFLHAVWPLFDLFNHFRLQAIMGSVVLFILAFCIRDRLSIFVCLFLIALNVTAAGYRLRTLPPVAPLDGRTPSLSIVFSNVLTSNRNREAVLAMIAEQNPDLLILSEVDALWIEALQPIEAKYKYSIKYPRSDNFGIAAYSKIPFTASIESIGAYGVPMAVLTLEGVTVVGVHPVPPGSHRTMEENNLYIDAAAVLAGKKNDPSIIVGDFNATLWSAALNPLADNDFQRINKSGIAYSWPVGNALLALQIDHFFAKNLSGADFKVLPSVGSDHYPIRADILL